MLMDPKAKRHAVAGVVCGVCLALIGVVAYWASADNQLGEGRELVGDDSAPLLVQHVSAVLPAFSAEELVEKSDLIVVGTVGAASDAFLVDPVDESMEPRFFTDTSVHVDRVLLGDPDYSGEVDDAIAVRTEGGTGELIQTVNDGTPKFESGDRYLLFLCQLQDGTYYNTEGDHYYIIGVSTGAWPESSGGSDTFDSPCWQAEGSQDISIDALEDIIAAKPASLGSEGDSTRHTGVNARLDEIESDFERGIITQQEYEYWLDLAEQEATSYARILTEDEQAAYEREVVEGNLGESVRSGS